MNTLTCAASVVYSIDSSVIVVSCMGLPALQKNIKFIWYKSNTLFTVFVPLLLTTVVSKHFNASVLTNPLYYLWFTFSEPLGKLMYCKIKGPHPTKP